MKAFPLLSALVFGIASTVWAEPKAAVFPFEPAQVLATLPTASAEWTTTRSEAETTLGDWPETRATRVFRSLQPAPATQQSSAPSAPVEVEISVTDTAVFAPSLAPFAGFMPGKSGNVEKKLIGSLLAIIFTGDDGRQLTQVLVSGRYIVEFSVSQSTHFRVDEWLRGFHFDTLPSQSNVPTIQSQEFRLAHIDELHPENNHSYSVSLTSSARVSAFLKTLKASPDDQAK